MATCTVLEHRAGRRRLRSSSWLSEYSQMMWYQAAYYVQLCSALFTSSGHCSTRLPVSVNNSHIADGGTGWWTLRPPAAAITGRRDTRLRCRLPMSYSRMFF
jgi:hypothetical protein